MKALISGATGYLGTALTEELLAKGYKVFSFSRSSHPIFANRDGFEEINLPSPVNSSEIRSVLESLRPDFIIHSGAISSPVECEKDPGTAKYFNTDFSALFAKEAASLGVFFTFLSTDLVFEGYESAPSGGFTEDDETRPLSVYAKSKIDAEKAILPLGNTAVVRTALILGPIASKGGGGICEALKAGKEVDLFYDEWRTPVYVFDLVKFLIILAESALAGLYHAAGPEKLSRAEIGYIFAEVFSLPRELINEKSRLGFTGSPARAPDVALNAGNIEECFDFKFKNLKEALEIFKNR